jgi:hypothetical protein
MAGSTLQEGEMAKGSDHLPNAGAKHRVLTRMVDARNKVPREQWESTLDQATWRHDGDYVTIEVLDPKLGDQLEVERLPFRYISYDRRDDTVVIAVGGTTANLPVVLRHLIAKPTTVSIDDTAEPPSMLITDTDSTSTLVTFYRGE